MFLLSQIYYYRWRRTAEKRYKGGGASTEAAGETSHLLAQATDAAISGDRFRSEKQSRLLSRTALYVYAACFIAGVGVTAYVAGPAAGDSTDEVIEWSSQVLGWMSATLYSKQSDFRGGEIRSDLIMPLLS